MSDKYIFDLLTKNELIAGISALVVLVVGSFITLVGTGALPWLTKEIRRRKNQPEEIHNGMKKCYDKYPKEFSLIKSREKYFFAANIYESPVYDPKIVGYNIYILFVRSMRFLGVIQDITTGLHEIAEILRSLPVGIEKNLYLDFRNIVTSSKKDEVGFNSESKTAIYNFIYDTWSRNGIKIIINLYENNYSSVLKFVRQIEDDQRKFRNSADDYIVFFHKK